jgi:hypothetical protein
MKTTILYREGFRAKEIKSSTTGDSRGWVSYWAGEKGPAVRLALAMEPREAICGSGSMPSG